MQAATCLQCTRIFVDPLDDQALPKHLDALLGTPCLGSGQPPAMSPGLSFEEPDLEIMVPMWAQR